MTKVLPSLMLCFALTILLSEAEPIRFQPQVLEPLNLGIIQINGGSCVYTVNISTSCSSPMYTGDHISLAFGDADGNQIYASRLDDPSTGTFERCSSDTFQVKGPCSHQICYLYLYRTGPYGWKPESVNISGDNSRDASFNFNNFIPNDMWYGFNLCGSASSAIRQPIMGWFMLVLLGVLASSLISLS